MDYVIINSNLSDLIDYTKKSKILFIIDCNIDKSIETYCFVIN